MFKTNKQVERLDIAAAAIEAFQERSRAVHGTYAYAAGFLGSMLVDQLMNAKKEDFDSAIKTLVNYTNRV